MALAAKRTAREAPTPTAPLTIADIVLARIAAGGATRAELQRDLAPVLAPKVTGTAFRRAAEAAIGTFAGQGLISETKGRLTTTAQGTRAAEAVVSAAKSTKGGWPGVHDALVLRALGCASDSSATARALDRADSFACLLLQQHFGLTGGKVLSMPDLRSELAVVALERAYPATRSKPACARVRACRRKPGGCWPANCSKARANSQPTESLFSRSPQKLRERMTPVSKV